jgi:dTDP-4-dehydrorhamnose reductase
MRIIVTGASGQLGTYVLDELAGSDHLCEGWSSGSEREAPGAIRVVPVDLLDEARVTGKLITFRPDVVIHLAAVSKPALVLADPGRAFLVNVEATRRLATWCQTSGCRLVFTSTDMVFDGRTAPYRENATPSPSNEYGRTKALGEKLVEETRTGLVLRLPLLYGPTRCGRESFYDHSLAALGRDEPRVFFEDEYRTPLDLLTAARLIIALAETNAVGIVHLGGPERLSRLDLMSRVARTLGIDKRLVGGNRLADHPGPEPRPVDTSLSSERIDELVPAHNRPAVEEAVRQMHPERFAG